MTQYRFTLDKLTIGDLLALIVAAKAPDMLTFATIADRYTVGGILNLPYVELGPALQQFTQAYLAECQAPGGVSTSPDVARILRQALGNEDGEAK